METMTIFADALNVVKNVCKTTKDIFAPVCIKNLGVEKNLNHLQIFNSGENLVRDVKIRIIGLPENECWWDHPNNSDIQELIIPYIEPHQHVEQELMFSWFDDAEVQFQITWEDWLGIKHSDTTCLLLEGQC
jgi:hypothetical protein